MSRAESGLIICGSLRGGGRSTTAAAVVEQINRERRCRTIVIGDAGESRHVSRQAVVTRRPAGSEGTAVEASLAEAARSDADVIAIDDIADGRIAARALQVADAGHLVVARMLTPHPIGCITALIELHDDNQQQAARRRLGNNLVGIATRLLVPAAGGGFARATAILLGTPGVRTLIREGRENDAYATMQAGRQNGMRTLTTAINDLVEEGKVDPEVGRHAAPDLVRSRARACIPSPVARHFLSAGFQGRLRRVRVSVRVSTVRPRRAKVAIC